MKLDILTFCLFCFHFEASFVDGDCSSCSKSCKENHNISIPEGMDGLPRRAVTFHCPLTARAVGFHMKLFKGRNREELCTFYAENRTENSSTKSCKPVFSANKVSFELRNLSKEVDTYTCCLETLVPIYSCCITNETYLYQYIQDIHVQASEECFLSAFQSWMLVLLAAFSTVSCICCFLFHCLRSTVSDSHSMLQNHPSSFCDVWALI
ncbi:uncharacterized protein LOC132585225 [Heteronotia binoei]|uniref:uncharacterized protein LOC132585225 n=1 Tax=Heteronotia binoei TaxID=13085 RepID=UPI00292DA255|nr:uncharacterized protein LOC132585225 [Heteronotia binoei]